MYEPPHYNALGAGDGMSESNNSVAGRIVFISAVFFVVVNSVIQLGAYYGLWPFPPGNIEPVLLIHSIICAIFAIYLRLGPK